MVACPMSILCHPSVLFPTSKFKFLVLCRYIFHYHFRFKTAKLHGCQLWVIHQKYEHKCWGALKQEFHLMTRCLFSIFRCITAAAKRNETERRTMSVVTSNNNMKLKFCKHSSTLLEMKGRERENKKCS